MKSDFLFPILTMMLVCGVFYASANVAPNKSEALLIHNDFEREKMDEDPVDPKNRCMKLDPNVDDRDSLEIPVDKLPANKTLRLRFRVYCDQWGGKGDGMLQLDVIGKEGSRGISQCRFPIGKKWTEVTMTFTTSDDLKEVSLYNKWTQNPVYIDDVRVDVVEEAEAK